MTGLDRPHVTVNLSLMWLSLALRKRHKGSLRKEERTAVKALKSTLRKVFPTAEVVQLQEG